MKVVAYLRVSTDRQVDSGLGLDVQEAACRAWAKAHKHRIVAVVQDAGKSGADDLVGRPALAEALGMVQAGQAGAIVVYRLDRLARDLVLQEFLRAAFIKAGGELHSTSDVEDRYLNVDAENGHTDPSATLVRQILGAVAEYERAMITLRMQAGKSTKIARGGYAHGRPPYGWRADGGRLVPHPGEQILVARILTLHKAGLSLRDIAANLTASGATTGSGAVWSSKAVARVIDHHQHRTGQPAPPSIGPFGATKKAAES